MSVVRAEREASGQRWGGGCGGRDVDGRPTVYYGLSGEGLGHVRRAAPVLEYLRSRARVVVLTSGKALEVVRAQFPDPGIELRAVPGYHFRYNSWGRLSIGGTVAAASRAALEIRALARSLAKELTRRRAVVISDFEPVTIQSAAIAGVPSMSIDHQRLLQACSFERACSRVRLQAEALRAVVDLLYGKPRRLVVSGFYLPEIKAQYPHARTAGVTIRELLLQVRPRVDPYLVAYVRRDCPSQVLRSLERSPLPVYLYGMGALQGRGQVHFCASSNEGFVARLAQAAGVVTTAGNQLIGESFFLEKPVLAFPEPGNPEQHINAWLLNESKGGLALSHRDFSPRVLASFLERRHTYVSALTRLRNPGNDTILRSVEEFLKETACFRFNGTWDERESTTPQALAVPSQALPV